MIKIKFHFLDICNHHTKHTLYQVITLNTVNHKNFTLYYDKEERTHPKKKYNYRALVLLHDAYAR